ncbi:hypothetical protein ABPG74_005105 [Tetrahymena malaccensis]
MDSSYSEFTLDGILSHTDYSKRKTKIVCTIGPSCWDHDNLVQLLENGMNVARLNFSHGDHAGHGETARKLKEAFKARKNIQCALMLDTKGPEIRTGLVKDQTKKLINLVAGQELEITTDYSVLGDEKVLACSYKSLPTSVKVGGQVLIADGTLVCIVKEIKKESVIVTVQNTCSIGEKKNMNLPGAIIDLPTVTEKDEDDIVNFGLKHGIDCIALSFTRKAEDIEYVRDILGPQGEHIKIIAKIENQEGLHNYEQILEAADGIMVARGDLGMEIPPQKVFVAQKWMIRKALEKGKPIITATQMMESMIKNPRPTRAEASDVANAVLDGTDAVMLSGETANGSFPIQAVQTMAYICSEAELCYDNRQTFWQRTNNKKKVSSIESMAISAVQMSFEIECPVIIVFTTNGDMARYVSKYRPSAQIFVVSTENGTIKGLCTTFGVRCLRVPSFQGINKLIDYAIDAAKEQGFVKSGQNAIVILGSNEEEPDQGDILKIKEVK